MYAKLKFNSGVSTALVIRDIVRLITESAAGNASLSNLGSIDTSNSTLTAGTNSGWTLYTGQSIPANSASASNSSDSYYTLQATSATNSRTKYCAIHGNCHFSSGSGMTLTSTSQAGVMLSNVDDPTLSNANTNFNFSTGYNSTSTSYMNDKGFIMGANGKELHIWADPTRIVLFSPEHNGANSASAGPLLIANLEGNQGTLDVWKQKCPTMTLYDSVRTVSTSGGYDAHGRGETYYTKNYGGRFFQLHNFTTQGPNHPGTTWSIVSYISISTTANVTGNLRGRQINSPWTEDVGSTMVDDFHDGFHSTILNYTGVGDAGQGTSTHVAFDNSGNSALSVKPLTIKVAASPTAYNFSDLTAIYIAPSNIGTTPSQVTIGSDTYTYITMDAANYRSYLIKHT